jgi:hypothetical protein
MFDLIDAVEEFKDKRDKRKQDKVPNDVSNLNKSIIQEKRIYGLIIKEAILKSELELVILQLRECGDFNVRKARYELKNLGV